MKCEIFSNRINLLRCANKLSMKELAEKLNVTKSAVNMWENNGNVPRWNILVNISNIFDVSIDSLLKK